VPPLAFALVFYAWPVGSVLHLGLTGDTPIGEVLADPALRRVVGFTAWQALLSTAATLAIGLPLAHVMGRRDFRGRKAVETLITVPFVLPTTVVGTAFVLLLGPSGPLPGGLTLTNTLAGVVLAHLFFNQAVVVRVVGGHWARLDPDLAGAARTMGATRWQAFREVTWPLLRPAVLSAAAIVFLFTFTSLGIILIVGGPRMTTIEVEILRQTRDFLDLPTAAGLALAQLVAISGVLAVSAGLQQRAAVATSLARRQARRRPTSAGERLWIGTNLGVAGLLVGFPLALLVLRSVRLDGTWTLAAWRGLGTLRRGTVLAVSPADAVSTTLQSAGLALLIALPLGLLAALVLARTRRRAATAMDALLTLPLGTSAVTIGFGFLIALDTHPLDLRTSPVLTPIAHALVALPFVIRILVPAARAIDPALRDVARSLGASPLRAIWEVDLGLLARPLAVAAGFAFAISAGEFGATVFIARPEYTTVPVAIYRLLGQPGASALAQAAALSVILLALVAGAIGVAEWAGRGERTLA